MLGGYQKNVVNNPLAAEVYAIRMALQMAKGRGWGKICITSDCKVAVELLEKDTRHEHELANIISDCRVLKAHFSEMHLRFEGRRSNRVADLLARSAKEELMDFNKAIWFQQPHYCCNQIYEEELLSCVTANESVT